MEKKFYEQGFGRRPIPVVKRSSVSEREVNQYVTFNSDFTERKKGFFVRHVENPESSNRKYNWED